MMLGAIAVWLGILNGVDAQSFVTVDQPAPSPITPKFEPARNAFQLAPPTVVGNAPQVSNHQQPGLVPLPVPSGLVTTQGFVDDGNELPIRPDLPGIERMFMRDSEAEFFNRLRQEAKRTPGSAPVIFPTQTPISKESYTQLPFPRIDPQTKKPFEERVCIAEPSYVCHRRLLFEQPNFERAGYNFGILQPWMSLGVFYYDLTFLPYHFWSDLHDRGECSVGKCLPGDPYAPMLLYRERFSVTGAIGQAFGILGAVYVVP